jgi:hypothetical protein
LASVLPRCSIVPVMKQERGYNDTLTTPVALVGDLRLC